MKSGEREAAINHLEEVNRLNSGNKQAAEYLDTSKCVRSEFWVRAEFIGHPQEPVVSFASYATRI